jgi:alpha,alpha-trehalase
MNVFCSQDKTLAMPFPSEDDKNELYSRLKAAAETGWDFSTKHYNNFGKNTGNICIYYNKYLIII